MSSPSNVLSEEQFLCSICLDVFTDPVTVPCGHNFCKNCITKHWNISVQSQCPTCKSLFNPRPELHINVFISELAAQFRQSFAKRDNSCSVRKHANSEVLCDVCTDNKLKALKSCMVCLTSYCQTHLELHQKITGLTRHMLIDPVDNLEDRMCKNHNRPLEVFCKTDQVCVCLICTESDHMLHYVVPLMEEYQKKKAGLGKTEAEIQLMTQERRLKVQELKHSMKLSKEDADREIADSMEIFTALVQSVERHLALLIDGIQEKQKRKEKQAEGFIRELEEEISELTKRSAEVEQLSCTVDHLQFLQSFPSLYPAPPTKDWSMVNVHSSYEGIVRRAVAQLEEMLNKEMKKVTEAELKRVQEFAVDLTLNPQTKHPGLVVSTDGKQVKCPSAWLANSSGDTPERFSKCACILGKQCISSGKCYYEVQVNGKTNWCLGVAKESIERKAEITQWQDKSLWAIWFKTGNECKALSGFVASSSPSRQKVGVFVDYEEGLVSFYDVDNGTAISDYTGCNFGEKLYPIFGPCDAGGKNSSPLIISPVGVTN